MYPILENIKSRLDAAFSSPAKSFDDVRTFKVGAEEFTLSDVKKDPGRVMIAITKETESMYAVEFANWTAAKDEALNPTKPRRNTLIQLYNRALEDGIIWRQIEQRALRISKTKFRIVDFKTREINQEKTDLLQKPWFKKYIKIAMASRAFGHSLMFIKDMQDGQVKDVDVVVRGHVVPEQNMILRKPNDNDGVDFTKPPYNKFTLSIGENADLGYLNKLIPLYILKKHSWAAWDKFEEMFGLPIRWAKTDKEDPKSINEIQRWLESMGKASYGIFDKNTEFELKESTRADAYQVFDMKRKAVNEEIVITVNGQTMTTMDGASRSQAEVHQLTQDDITVDDLDFIQGLTNYDLMALLNFHGYGFDENDVFEWDLPEDLEAKLKIFKGVNDMGFELDQDQVSKVFGVNIVGKIEGAAPKDNEPKK